MKPEDKSKRSNKKGHISKDSEYNVRSLDMYRTSDAYKKRKDTKNAEMKIDRKDNKPIKDICYQKEFSNQNDSYDNTYEKRERSDYKKDSNRKQSNKKQSNKKESNEKQFSSAIKQKPSVKKRVKIKRPVYSKKTIALFLSMSVIAVSAFSSVGFLMYRYSQVSDMKYEVNTLNNNLLQIKNQKKEIEVELETTNRSELIEQIAIDVLKMQYPAEEKIVYIKVD